MWGQNLIPIFLYAWHVLKAWCLCSMEKIKGSKVSCAVFDHLHMVMFMSINLDETIDDFKAWGGRWWWKILITYNLVLFGKDIFGLIIANLVSKRSPFQVRHNLKPFYYGCITWMHVHFSHIFKLHHGLKVCYACPCKTLDGWVLSSATFESRHIS